MRLPWKRRQPSSDPQGRERSGPDLAEEPKPTSEASDDDAEVDAIAAAKEARQMLHVSETTVWRYKSGLW